MLKKQSGVMRFAVMVCLFLLCTGSASAGPTKQERIPLRYGDVVNGMIDNVRFFQQYSFEGKAGDQVTITMEASAGNLDPLLLLGDSALNLIAEDDDGAGGFDAQLEITLPADGVYVIEATRYGQDTEVGRSTGSFQLTLVANQVDSRSAVPLAGVLAALDFGKTRRGVLNSSDQFHLFWFQAQEGDRVRIGADYGAGLSAILTLYDPSLQLIAQDDTGRQVQATLESGGVYWVGLASDMRDSSGTYAITLSGSITDPRTGEAPPYLIAYNEQVEGTISDGTPRQLYEFVGQAGDQVVIGMLASTESLDPYLYLYGPGGEIVGQDDDGGGSPNAELAVVLPVDGSYTIVATRFGGDAGRSNGAYELDMISSSTMSDDDLIRETGPVMPDEFVGLPQIGYGNNVGGAIDDTTYSQAYVVEVAAGDDLVITLENMGGNLDPLLMVMDASLNVVAEHDDISDQNKNARIEWTAPDSGYYAILAMRFNGETGTTSGEYRLSLEATNTIRYSQVASLLPVNELALGTLSAQLSGDALAEFYRFYALRGDNIQLDLSGADSLEDGALLILADANLRELSVGVHGQLQYSVAQDGAYYLIVTRQGGPLGTARGVYDLTLSGITVEAPEQLGIVSAGPYVSGDLLPYGTVVVGSLSDTSFEDRFRFVGQRGDRITLRLDALDDTLDPALQLLGPDGRELLRDDDSGGNLNAVIPAYLLTEAGEYEIVIGRSGGREGSSRGRYELLLAGVPVTEPDTEPGLSGSSPALALALVPGQTVSGSVSASSVATFYRLEGQSGVTLQLDMVRVDGDLDCFLVMLDEAQNLIGANDDGGGGQDARLQITFPADGVYYVGATRFEFMDGQTEGEYLLSVVER